MSENFEMVIKDVFQFQDGRRVLAGDVEGGGDYIVPDECEIWVQGLKRGTIRIEGEMVPCGSNRRERAVSTREPTGVDKEVVAQSECPLKSAG